jgi:NAD+ diphosphatase
MSPRPDLGPKPRLGYTASLLERAAECRADAAAMAAFENDRDARAYVVGGELIVLKKAAPVNDPLFTLAEARALGRTTAVVFLGLLGEAARFAIALDARAADALKTSDDFVVTDLRSVAARGLVGADDLPPLAEGKALLHWHTRHRFCPNCGAPSNLVEAGWRRDCPACKTQHFPRTDPVVIMLPVAGERCVLGRSYRFVGSMWSCLAGFIEPGEAIEDAVRRETREEVGIEIKQLRYFGSQPWPFPHQLMIAFTADYASGEVTPDGVEIEEARFFDVGELPNLPASISISRRMIDTVTAKLARGETI